jgi:trans-aconitate 2-methyltransferase
VTHDWDAATYDRVSDPQVEMATAVMDRLELCGGETVLDAGCGSGRVTALLSERCARVIAVDGSESMVEKAREALPADVTVLAADLQELVLEEPVEAVFSNAVFHWVPDHALLFRRMHDALRPGGRMSAQCGGRGNIDEFRAIGEEVVGREPFAERFAGWTTPWNYATPEDTEARLEAAGFTGIQTWLQPWPVTPGDPVEYAGTVCLGSHLEHLPEELRRPFVDAVLAELPEPLELGYVRLNIVAERPG